MSKAPAFDAGSAVFDAAGDHAWEYTRMADGYLLCGNCGAMVHPVMQDLHTDRDHNLHAMAEALKKLMAWAKAVSEDDAQ